MTRSKQTRELVRAESPREEAAARGRRGERLEAAFEAVAAIARRLDGSADAAERTRLLEDYEVARARAREARLTLLIQREALGVRHHRAVDEHFPEPPRRQHRA